MPPIKRGIYIALALAVFSLTLVATTTLALAAPTFNRPVNESTHQTNAIVLSRTAFPGGAATVVVTGVDSYADSLSASVLAKACSGPLLLTSSSVLNADVASELTRLHPSKVFLVGLPASFVTSVKASVSGLTSSNVTLLDGADRYETAALVAAAVKSRLGSVSKVVIAPGDSYGAALAASSLAAAQGWPLLLMPAAGPLPQSAKNAIAALGVTSGVVVGTAASLGVDNFTVTDRIVGRASDTDADGHYDAAAKLAAYATERGWLSYAHVGIVSGDDYPDAEAAAAYLARDKGVLLFSKASALPAVTIAALQSHGPAIKNTDVIGLGWEVYRHLKSLNSAKITGLSATKGPTAGGNTVVLTGTSLDKATGVRVGKKDVPAAYWHADSATQLTISSMPGGYGEGPAEVIVYDYWGASPSSTHDLYWYGDGVAVSNGQKVVQKALEEYLGTPYLWAGASPATGFDCSGLCMYVYKQFGVSLPHYSRAMSAYGTAVSKSDLQPGDLVFFYAPISHVGMYVGGGLMINAPRSGDLVCIEDVFRSSYVTARRMVSPYSRYQQTDSHLAYTGTWRTTTTAAASGGSFSYADCRGSSVTVAFNGSYLGLITKKSSVYGKAKVTVDGGAPATIDLYSGDAVFQKLVWNTGILTQGAHTVKIEWTGTKNSASAGTNIGIDAVEIKGSLTQAGGTVTPPPATNPVRFEQTDPHIAYGGTWATFSGTGPSGGTYARASWPGASATIKFNGTYLAWIATRGTTLGKAQVSLDGGQPATVDLAATAVAYQQKVWDTGTLSAGSHTVVISKGSTDTASKYVSVDAVEILGTLESASAREAPVTPPTTTRYEQTDSRFTFAGGWVAASSTSASKGSFRYTNSKSSATVSFNGTYFEWIGKKSSVYGKAKVTVDSKPAVLVDLYSATTLWQQKIWDTGVLSAGTHTVKIEWTGAANPAAQDANINVDAFNIAGSITQATAAAPQRYEQSAKMQYTGAWTPSYAASASAGSFCYANSTGSSVTITFTGSYLAWIAKKSSVYGKARVTLDGGAPVTVDLYSSVVAYQQKVWQTKMLVPGAHTVKIEWTGAKNSASSGTNIGVDAFDIIGTL